MNLEDYRTVFTACGLALMLIGASPILSLVIPIPQNSERFSELWILGPGHTGENYPFNVSTGVQQQVFVGVSNHMDQSAYYAVYVKLRNQTQLGPSSNTSSPSPVPILYEFRFVLPDGGNWQQSMSFSILQTSNNGSLSSISRIMINNDVFVIDRLAAWDSANSGFFYQLFLELWMYDNTVSNFAYQNRFVALWLNVTG